MKQLKISIALLAFVFAIGSAFTVNKVLASDWRFSGTDATDWTQRVNNANYTQIATTCPSGDDILCKIVADDVSPADGKPDITVNGTLYNKLKNDEEEVPEPDGVTVFLKGL